jgi:hypothetical protein
MERYQLPERQRMGRSLLNISETPISINKLGLVMLRCIPSQLGGNVRGSWSKAEKIKRISL